MLRLDGENFTTGLARYFDSDPAGESREDKIYLKIQPGGLAITLLALVDTGSPWCVLHPEVADAMGIAANEGTKESLSTRFGTVVGRLVRAPIRVLADQGESLDVDATVFVPDSWGGPNFVGYTGLLQRIRFAVDPIRSVFYFGLPS